MTASDLLALKAVDPAAYQTALDAISEKRGIPVASRPATVNPRQRTADAMLSHFVAAYGLSEAQAGQLDYIRRGAIYACVTLRSDMLASLPIKAYRLGAGGRGRKVDVRDPLARRGMPMAARGVRLADAGTVTEVEGSDLTRRLARPNEDWTGSGLMRMTEMSLGLAGQAFWRMFGRGTSATKPPQEIGYVRHDKMEVIKATKGDSARTIAGWVIDPRTADQAVLAPGEVLWLRYPDPADPDYGVLAPGDVARLGADSYQDAMSSNRDIFKRGLTPSGIILPPEGQEFLSEQQMLDLDRDIGRRFTAKESKHRLAIMRHRFQVESLATVSPKDAEFVALMDFAIEDAARVYRIPIEFVGGTRRTYQNMDAAYKGIWMMALEPEATWIGDELTARLVPMFGDQIDFVALDLSDVTALQDDEAERWRIAREQMEVGALTANEYREGVGLDPLATAGQSIEVGKVVAIFNGLQAMGQGYISPESLKAVLTGAIGLDDEVADAIVGPAPEPVTEAPQEEPADDPQPEEPEEPGEYQEEPEEQPVTEAASMGVRRIEVPEYGSDGHARIMERASKALAPYEAAVAKTVRALFERQKASILDRMGARAGAGEHARMSVADLTTIFQRPRWIREFRQAIKPDLEDTVKAAGAALVADVAPSSAFDATAPAAVNFLRARAQRFAETVNETTWTMLKDSLGEGMQSGETMKDLAARVESVMADRIRSSATTIARTEVLGAYSGGSQLAAEQTGLDLTKVWMSALDDRVRDDHRDAHGQNVPMSEPFEVGGEEGMFPGDFDDPAQTINCRCTVVYAELDEARIMEVADAIPAATPTA